VTSEEHNDAARMYREAAEAYLGGPKVEAAGIFKRPDDGWLSGSELGAIASFFAALYWLVSPWGKLRGTFLIAVTKDKVHALKYGGTSESVTAIGEIAAFDRDDVWVRSYAGGEVFLFEDRRHQVDLDGAAVEENPGAAEVVAALSD
jgi:hypothetical protein